MLIIGVVGQIASGKGILVNYLTRHFDFISYSLSSIVHDELKKKKIGKFTRQMLQDMGDELRRVYGDQVLAQRTLEVINVQKKGRIIMEGIRNPGEIEFLKKNSKNFILVGVKANKKLRFKRLLSRGKEWDPQTYEDFLKVDRRDVGVGQNSSGQQVGKCMKYCDHIVTNNSSINEFVEKIAKLMKKTLKK